LTRGKRATRRLFGNSGNGYEFFHRDFVQVGCSTRQPSAGYHACTRCNWLDRRHIKLRRGCALFSWRIVLGSCDACVTKTAAVVNGIILPSRAANFQSYALQSIATGPQPKAW